MPNISSFEWKIKKRKEGKVNITSIEVIVDTPIETFIKEKKQEHIVSPIVTEQKEPVGGSPLAMKPTRVMGPTIWGKKWEKQNLSLERIRISV